MIELVVFDMAGTTIEDGDAVNSCFRDALAASGVTVSAAEVTPFMGYPKPEAIRLILAGRGLSRNEREIEGAHADFAARMQRFYATSPQVREIAGAAAAFARLRERGVKVALNTGFGRPIARAALLRLGWEGPGAPVDATVPSDEVGRGRPPPDMIRRLMSELGVRDPSRVAKVGDTPVDLEEGWAAGCGMVFGVTTGSFTREQ